MNGKIIIEKPSICDCVIRIDGVEKNITTKEIELPFGVHKINVGIKYYEAALLVSLSGIEWAWENDKEVSIDETVTTIKIKRKWHLLKHITAEATINKGL